MLNISQQIKSHKSNLRTHTLVPATTGWVGVASKLSLSVTFIVYVGALSVKVTKL
jgi:hypothetical protein